MKTLDKHFSEEIWIRAYSTLDILANFLYIWNKFSPKHQKKKQIQFETKSSEKVLTGVFWLVSNGHILITLINSTNSLLKADFEQIFQCAEMKLFWFRNYENMETDRSKHNSFFLVIVDLCCCMFYTRQTISQQFLLHELKS